MVPNLLPRLYPKIETCAPLCINMCLCLQGNTTLRLGALNYLFVHGRVQGAYCLGVFDNGSQGTLLGGITFRNVYVQVLTTLWCRSEDYFMAAGSTVQFWTPQRQGGGGGAVVEEVHIICGALPPLPCVVTF